MRKRPFTSAILLSRGARVHLSLHNDLRRFFEHAELTCLCLASELERIRRSVSDLFELV